MALVVTFLSAQAPIDLSKVRDWPSKLATHSVKVNTGLSVSVEGRTYEEKSFNYIGSKWSELGFSSAPIDALIHNQTKSFNSGVVVRFRQYYNDLRVDNNEYTLRFDKYGRICLSLNSPVPINDFINLVPTLSSSSAVDVIKNALKSYWNVKHLSTELMIHIFEDIPRLCYNVNIGIEHPIGDLSAYIDAVSGELLEISHMSQAINGTGRVFNPNPTYSAKANYGDNGTNGAFIDGNDASNIEIENQLMDVDLLDISVDANLKYVLIGPYAEIVDYGSPYDGLYEQSSTDFIFNREDDEFEAVMCYYQRVEGLGCQSMFGLIDATTMSKIPILFERFCCDFGEYSDLETGEPFCIIESKKEFVAVL